MATIRFDFDEEKLVQVLAYLAEKGLSELTPLKASKLLFLADKKHFAAHGRPILGDAYVGLRNGPCPSRSLNLMRELAGQDYNLPASFKRHALPFEEYVKVDSTQGTNPVFVAVKAPDLDVFSRSELEVLEQVVREHGSKTGRQLVDLTHQDPAYVSAWRNRSNENRAEIPYELFFEGSGPETDEIRGLVAAEQDNRDFVVAR